jgi:hypothetical protein
VLRRHIDGVIIRCGTDAASRKTISPLAKLRCRVAVIRSRLSPMYSAQSSCRPRAFSGDHLRQVLILPFS